MGKLARGPFALRLIYETFRQVMGGGRGLCLLLDGQSLSCVSAHTRGKSGAGHAAFQWGIPNGLIVVIGVIGRCFELQAAIITRLFF